MKARLIQVVDGRLDAAEFDEARGVDVVAAMALRGYQLTHLNANPRQRAELQGAPVFRGVLGPMFDGDALRYETQAAYEILSA